MAQGIGFWAVVHGSWAIANDHATEMSWHNMYSGRATTAVGHSIFKLQHVPDSISSISTRTEPCLEFTTHLWISPWTTGGGGNGIGI